MVRKGRKGKGASAASAMNEVTLVRVTKALDDFRASDAEGSHPFASSCLGGCFCALESRIEKRLSVLLVVAMRRSGGLALGV